MRLAYYPGCSLRATSRAYDESSLAIAKPLGIQLEELEDWNCCGATSYMSVRELLSVAISARNLGLAEKQGLDIVTPCSACFTVLRKTDRYLREIPELRKRVASVLEAADLSYAPGSVQVRHLLELVTRDDCEGRLRTSVRNPLTGLKVAPYYGCQIVRPRVEFDNPELPDRLDGLLRSLGAEVVTYPVKSRCCGASLMASNEAAALRLCKNLLLCAEQNGAECIATVCPLCQMNLDAFQNRVNERFGTHFQMPILYFTQLLGLAMALPPAELGLGREMVPAAQITARYADGWPRSAPPHRASARARA